MFQNLPNKKLSLVMAHYLWNSLNYDLNKPAHVIFYSQHSLHTQWIFCNADWILFCRKWKLETFPGGSLKSIKNLFPPWEGTVFVTSLLLLALTIWGWQFPLPRYPLIFDWRHQYNVLRGRLRDYYRVELKATHKLSWSISSSDLVVVLSDISD